MHNFIETPICMGRERTAHPTQKPKKVISRLVDIFTNPNDIVLDCFAGSGTLAEIAIEFQRNSISIEKDKLYFNLMAQRIKHMNNGLFNQDMRIVEIKNKKDIARIKEFYEQADSTI